MRQYGCAKFIQVLPAGQARDDAFWPPRAPRARRALLPDAVRDHCLRFVVDEKVRRSGAYAGAQARAQRAKSPPPDARATRRSASSTSPQPLPAEAKAPRASTLLQHLKSEPWVRRESKDGAKVSFLRLSRNADSVVVGVDASVDGDGIAMTVTLCGRSWDVETRKCSPVDLGPRTVDCPTFLSLMAGLGTGRTCCGVEKEDLSENLRNSFVEATEVAIRGGAREVATSEAGSWVLGRRAAPRGRSEGGALLLRREEGAGGRFVSDECDGIEMSSATWARGLGCCAACRELKSSVRRSCHRRAARDSETERPVKKGRIGYIATEDEDTIRAVINEKNDKLRRARVRAEQLYSREGALLKADFSELLEALQRTPEFKHKCPEGSVARALWETNWKNIQRAVKGKAASSARYHPDVLRLAIHLLISVGQRNYEECRSLMGLPGVRRLRDYKNALPAAEGVQWDALKAGAEQWLEPGERCFCVIARDSMSMREGIVVNNRTGEIEGFHSEELDDFSHIMRRLEGDASAGAPPARVVPEADLLAAAAAVDAEHHKTKKYADHWYETFLVPVDPRKHFALSVYRTPHAALHPWDIDEMLHKVLVAADLNRFDVLADVADKAGEHVAHAKYARSMSVADLKRRLHGADAEVDAADEARLVAMPHPTTGEPIALLSDPPHLLKTLLNNIDRWEKNRETGGSVTLVLLRYDAAGVEHQIHLRHLFDVWKRRVAGSASRGLKPDKFTTKHFVGRDVMRVKPAAQVLSDTMAQYVREDRLLSNNQPMIDYLAKANRMFDIMNHGGCVDDASDRKLEELDEYVVDTESWNADNQARKLAEKHFLTAATFHGVQSLGCLTAVLRYYLEKYENVVIAMKRLSQDIVEHHFGHMRQRGGDQRNPDVSMCRTAARDAVMFRMTKDGKSNSGAAAVDESFGALLPPRERPRQPYVPVGERDKLAADAAVAAARMAAPAEARSDDDAFWAMAVETTAAVEASSCAMELEE